MLLILDDRGPEALTPDQARDLLECEIAWNVDPLEGRFRLES
jgi:hypothetical protein